jgi:hypothetical protein
MRKFNARRRFRAGIMAAKAISGLSVLSVKSKAGTTKIKHVIEEAKGVEHSTASSIAPTTETTTSTEETKAPANGETAPTETATATETETPTPTPTPTETEKATPTE